MFEFPSPVVDVMSDGRVSSPGPEVADKVLQVSMVAATNCSPSRAFTGNTTVPFRRLETSMQFRPQLVCEVEGYAGMVDATNCERGSIVGTEGRGVRLLARHSKLNADGGFALTLLAYVLVLAQAVPQSSAFTFDDHIYRSFVDVHVHFENR